MPANTPHRLLRYSLLFFLVFTLLTAAPAENEGDGKRPGFAELLASLPSEEAAFCEKIHGADRLLMTRLKLARKQAVSKADKKQLTADLQALREAYQRGLAAWPGNARLRNWYGELLYDGFGEIPAAVRQWHEAVSLDEKYGHPHNNLALYHFKHGFYEQGLRELDTALRLDGKNPDFLYNLVQLYLIHYPQIGEIRGWDKDKIYREAMKASRKAAKLAPEDFDLQQDYAVNFFAAGNFEIAGDWKRCAKAWQTARAKARNDVDRFYTHLNEGRAWIRAGDGEKALESLRAALKLRPDSRVTAKLIAGVESGDFFEDD
jgi:tetratricopeptide (TPR) repeat protein